MAHNSTIILICQAKNSMSIKEKTSFKSALPPKPFSLRDQYPKHIFTLPPSKIGQSYKLLLASTLSIINSAAVFPCTA